MNYEVFSTHQLRSLLSHSLADLKSAPREKSRAVTASPIQRLLWRGLLCAGLTALLPACVSTSEDSQDPLPEASKQPFALNFQLQGASDDGGLGEVRRVNFGSKSHRKLVDLMLPETIQGGHVFVPQGILAKGQRLEVRMQYVNGVTISDEGPHLDLQDWVTYTSEWVPMKANANGVYAVPDLTRPQQQQFPKVSIDALRKEVHRVGGDRWSSLVTKIKNPTDYPADVSTFLIRVRFTLISPSGVRESYMIEFNEAQGC